MFHYEQERITYASCAVACRTTNDTLRHCPGTEQDVTIGERHCTVWRTVRYGTARYVTARNQVRKAMPLHLPPTPNRRISALRLKIEEFKKHAPRVTVPTRLRSLLPRMGLMCLVRISEATSPESRMPRPRQNRPTHRNHRSMSNQQDSR